MICFVNTFRILPGIFPINSKKYLKIAGNHGSIFGQIPCKISQRISEGLPGKLCKAIHDLIHETSKHVISIMLCYFNYSFDHFHATFFKDSVWCFQEIRQKFLLDITQEFKTVFSMNIILAMYLENPPKVFEA